MSSPIPVQESSGTQKAAFEMLMNAIGSLLGPVVQQLLSSDPNLVKLKGFHGMTALHRACLIGDYSIILLLIQHNSDVNALTDFDETPLHYAFKRGIVSVVHLLIQCGAKVDAVDKNGKTVLHHAAETGSVYVMKYMEEVYSVSFRDVDNKGQTPLHISCNQTQIELFKFLIAKGRSDLRQVDIDGNLALHNAARNGNGTMAWSLLTIMGVSALKRRNKEGFTPVDLVEQGDTVLHRELVPVLTYYGSQPDTTPVTGPTLLWYYWLLCPFLLFLLLVLSTHFVPRHQCFLFIVVLLIFFYTIQNTSHRLPHISRWPNPFYTGFYIAGISHTMLCFYLNMAADVETFMRYSLFFGVGMNTALVFLSYRLFTDDPGKVNQSATDTTSGKYLTMVDICTVHKSELHYCSICDLIVPIATTKHCKLCETCAEQLDHHCLFIYKCVAKNNHILFVWFLLVNGLNMLLYCLVYCLHVYNMFLFGNLRWFEVVEQIYHGHAWTTSVLLLNLCSFTWVVCFLSLQLSVISAGTTTYFRYVTRVNSRLNFSQRVSNCVNFLMNKPLPFKASPKGTYPRQKQASNVV